MQSRADITLRGQCAQSARLRSRICGVLDSSALALGLRWVDTFLRECHVAAISAHISVYNLHAFPLLFVTATDAGNAYARPRQPVTSLKVTAMLDEIAGVAL